MKIKTQKGLSTFELMLTATLFLAMSSIVVTRGTSLLAKNDVQVAATSLDDASRDVAFEFSAANDFQILNRTSQTAWGELQLMPANFRQEGDGWQARLTHVPSDACIQIIQRELHQAWTTISVDEIRTIRDSGPNAEPESSWSDVSDACQGGDHTVILAKWGGRS